MVSIGLLGPPSTQAVRPPLPVESNWKIKMKTRVFQRLMTWMCPPLVGTKHDSLYWDILLSSSIFHYFFQLSVGKWWNRQYLSLGPQPFIFWFHLHCRGPGDQTVRAHIPWDFPGKSIGVGYHCLLLLNAYCELNILEILTTTTWSLYTQGVYSLRREERHEKRSGIAQCGVVGVKGTRRGR